jgi:hypothetical protein
MLLARLPKTIGMVSPGVPMRCALSISADGFLLVSSESSNLLPARAGFAFSCGGAWNTGSRSGDKTAAAVAEIGGEAGCAAAFKKSSR